MGKVSNTLLMLKYLTNHRKYSVKELADKLEVSERMVKSYKADLEMAGIFIETIKGRDGGYILYDDMVLPKLLINRGDIEIICELKEKIDDQVLLSKLNMLLNKLNYNYIAMDIVSKSLPENVNEKVFLNQLSDAAAKNYKLLIGYENTNGIKEFVIHPSLTFMRGEEWVIAAYLVDKLQLFYLNRIKKVEKI